MTLDRDDTIECLARIDDHLTCSCYTRIELSRQFTELLSTVHPGIVVSEGCYPFDTSQSKFELGD